jgi:hypothetical protein
LECGRLAPAFAKWGVSAKGRLRWCFISRKSGGKPPHSKNVGAPTKVSNILGHDDYLKGISFEEAGYRGLGGHGLRSFTRRKRGFRMTEMRCQFLNWYEGGGKRDPESPPFDPKGGAPNFRPKTKPGPPALGRAPFPPNQIHFAGNRDAETRIRLA